MTALLWSWNRSTQTSCRQMKVLYSMTAFGSLLARGRRKPTNLHKACNRAAADAQD